MLSPHYCQSTGVGLSKTPALWGHFVVLQQALCCMCVMFALQVKTILQQLTAMNPNPTIGLAEAAEMLCKHLGVSLVRCGSVLLAMDAIQAHGASTGWFSALQMLQPLCGSAADSQMPRLGVQSSQHTTASGGASLGHRVSFLQDCCSSKQQNSASRALLTSVAKGQL